MKCFLVLYANMLKYCSECMYVHECVPLSVVLSIKCYKGKEGQHNARRQKEQRNTKSRILEHFSILLTHKIGADRYSPKTA